MRHLAKRSRCENHTSFSRNGKAREGGSECESFTHDVMQLERVAKFRYFVNFSDQLLEYRDEGQFDFISCLFLNVTIKQTFKPKFILFLSGLVNFGSSNDTSLKIQH